MWSQPPNPNCEALRTAEGGPDCDHVALRPQKRDGLLGTGTGGGGGRARGRESEGSTADTARKRPERPWTAARTMEIKAVSPRHCAATSALRNCCFNCRAGQSHKDNVRCTAVEASRPPHNRTLYLAVIVEQHLQDQLKNASAHDCSYENSLTRELNTDPQTPEHKHPQW